MKFTLEERPSDSSFVERVWRAHSGRTGTFLSQAKSCWQIAVTKHEGQTMLTVRGPETEATPMDVQWTEGEFVGIDFQLGTFLPHLPPGQVIDLRDANLPKATSTSFWLCGSAWSYPNYDNVDTFVDRLVRSGLLVRDPIVEAVLHGRQHEMSPRSVQYRFVQATGLSYRTIQQIERARQAAALLEQGRSIPDVVYQAGYFDQPHLTHALQRFLGQTPAQIARFSQPE